MKKIFVGIYYFLITIGFILFLFVFSLILTSFAYFNNNINTLNKIIEISPYLQEEVKEFICYGEKEIVIEVEFLNYKNEEFLKMYALYYFDNFKKPIQLLVINQNIILVINSEGEIVVNEY
jgi:hypothetical protein